jgi:radical SAM superfamily enzyme with C-terminal helix-hairpin-helix motif
LLKELFPLGQRLSDVYWETHDGRTRLPIHQTSTHTDEAVHGKPGLTFGRQIGAYPILIGVPYHIPLDTSSDILVTGHGARSITGIEVGLRIQDASQKQLEAIPGIGKKTAWNLVSSRAKLLRKQDAVSLDEVFRASNTELTEAIKKVLCDSELQ